MKVFGWVLESFVVMDFGVDFDFVRFFFFRICLVGRRVIWRRSWIIGSRFSIRFIW